jgi:hypothetical protein
MQQESFDNEKDSYHKGEDVGTRTNVVAADDLHFSKESPKLHCECEDQDPSDIMPRKRGEYPVSLCMIVQ